MSVRMSGKSSAEAWFRTAKEHLSDADYFYAKGKYDSAYRYAVYSGEIALKAVLVKFNKFIQSRHKHHDQSRLVQNIRAEKCLPQDMIDEIDGTVSSLDNVDLQSERGDYVVCGSHQVGNLRYSVGESTPAEMIGREDAEEKIRLAKELLDLLSRIF